MEIWQYNKIKALENNSLWQDAANEWRKHNYIEDANACQLIANAIKEGDKLRTINK